MEVELRIKFAGVCLYVMHPNKPEVAVLMPECRRRKVPGKHKDKWKAEPHVGYMRFDLANLSTAASAIEPGTGNDGPLYEGIHRFDNEEVDLGLGAADGMTTEGLSIPDFGMFAPDLKPSQDLFSNNPQTPPLMRIVLRGGSLIGVGDRSWEFSQLFNPHAPPHTGFFTGHVTWTRGLDSAETLVIRIRRFGRSRIVEIPLTPVTIDGKKVISLTMGNLCCNALEWEDLATRSAAGPDKDFKWLYRLLAPQSSTYEALLAGDKELPHPLPAPPVPQGIEHCIGGKIDFPFPL
jgi:hypothetical protein